MLRKCRRFWSHNSRAAKSRSACQETAAMNCLAATIVISGGGIFGTRSAGCRASSENGGGGITTVSPSTWDAAFQGLGPVLPAHLKQRVPGDKLHKLAEVLAVEHPEAMYRNLVSSWKTPTRRRAELRGTGNDFDEKSTGQICRTLCCG